MILFSLLSRDAPAPAVRPGLVLASSFQRTVPNPCLSHFSSRFDWDCKDTAIFKTCKFFLKKNQKKFLPENRVFDFDLNLGPKYAKITHLSVKWKNVP